MAAKRGRYGSFTAFHGQKHGNRPLKDVLDELRTLPRDLIKDRLARIRRAGIGVIAGRINDHDWSHYDYRHVVLQPMSMSAEELQAGADWLIAEFYRLDRVLRRFARNIFSLRLASALIGLKLSLTYRYDVKRGKIIGWNPAAENRRANSIRNNPDLYDVAVES